MKIVWDNRLKRAFRKLIKKNPELQERIMKKNGSKTPPFKAKCFWSGAINPRYSEQLLTSDF